MYISKFAPGVRAEALVQFLAELQGSVDSSSLGSADDAFAQLLAELHQFTGSTILRLPVVLHERGDRSRSAHYQDIKDGLFTEPISIGARAVGWPAREVAVLNAARIAGKTDNDMRALVQNLHAARKWVL